jgi:hypothetical protein
MSKNLAPTYCPVQVNEVFPILLFTRRKSPRFKRGSPLGSSTYRSDRILCGRRFEVGEFGCGHLALSVRDTCSQISAVSRIQSREQLKSREDAKIQESTASFSSAICNLIPKPHRSNSSNSLCSCTLFFNGTRNGTTTAVPGHFDTCEHLFLNPSSNADALCDLAPHP